ncbi:Fe-S-cluster-containing hydrogenase component 2 [Desulfohalotomaculum tongense]|uniref:4Fe-4S binding protein n=1 Tax=Desulforadius tongensis TaxID=1216062 RepID=UPI0019586D17|nr:4Fe-4S binding protein [Desulforadius tongensis]MBM7854740.1 Fe-S-cluster-containing hydrogenase component 2 [Desulforadius tongensis]
MLAQNGVPAPEDLAEVMPSEERLARGPVAMAECFQNIPCDPCYHSCRRQAIKPFSDINDRPQIDHELCNGCGMCLSRCPGLAIFVIDQTYGEKEALVKIPYEYLPLPGEGDVVEAVNRAGETVGEARVAKVQSGAKLDGTAIVWLVVPRELSMEVRHFKIKGGR